MRAECNIRIAIIDGFRQGNIVFGSVNAHFPRYAITSTNLNQLAIAGRYDMNLKSKFLEIVEFEPNRLWDAQYFNRQARKFREIVQNNPDKICVFIPKHTKTMRIDKRFNELLVKFQSACGFVFIRVFLKNNRDALQDLEYYNTLLSEDQYIFPVIDENLKNTIFESLYLWGINKNLPFIGFVGRGFKKRNNDNKLNFLFIRNRKDDKIVRWVSDIKKSINGTLNSLVYTFFHFDVYSTLSRKGSQQKGIFELQIFIRRNFVPLTTNGHYPCVIIPTNTISQSVDQFSQIQKSSVPVNIFNTLKINELYERLSQEFTENGLEQFLGELVTIQTSL